MNLPKYSSVFVFLCNTLIIVGSVILIYTAISMTKIPPEKYKHYVSIFQLSFITFAACLIFMSIFGYFGVAFSSTLCMFVYAVLTVIFVLAQMLFVYLLFFQAPKVREQLDKALVEDSVKLKAAGRLSKIFHKELHEFQRQHQCCGINSIDEWLKLSDHIPGSCCHREDEEVCEEADLKNVKPCRKVLGDRLDDNFHLLQATTVGLLIAQISSVIFTCCEIYL